MRKIFHCKSSNTLKLPGSIFICHHSGTWLTGQPPPHPLSAFKKLLFTRKEEEGIKSDKYSLKVCGDLSTN